jgi:hypothetical protein
MTTLAPKARRASRRNKDVPTACGRTVTGMLLALPLALTGPEGPVVGAGITATLGLGGTVYLNAVGRKRENDARQRDLYSNAYRSALEWCEAVYRVRRRKPDGSQDYELVERFHDLQERIAYYEGMLSIESAQLGRAYRIFRDAVKAECLPLITEAWSCPGRQPSEPTPDDEKHPDLVLARERFCAEVREHTAPWWNPPETPDRYR